MATGSDRLSELRAIKNSLIGSSKRKTEAITSGQASLLAQEFIDWSTRAERYCSSEHAETADEPTAQGHVLVLEMLNQLVAILAALALPRADALVPLIGLDAERVSVPQRMLNLLATLDSFTRRAAPPGTSYALVRDSRACAALQEALARGIKTIYRSLVALLGPTPWGLEGATAYEKRGPLAAPAYASFDDELSAAFGEKRDALAVFLRPLTTFRESPRLAEYACLFLSGCVRRRQDQNVLAAINIWLDDGADGATAGMDVDMADSHASKNERDSVAAAGKLIKHFSILHAVADIIEFSHGRLRQSALDAFAALVRDHEASSERVTILRTAVSPDTLAVQDEERQSFMDFLLGLTRDSSPRLRLSAASCFVTVMVTLDHQSSPECKELLSVLMGLLEDTDYSVVARAAFTLAHLVWSSLYLQKELNELGCLTVLRSLLERGAKRNQPYATTRSLEEDAELRESVLLVVAAFALTDEELRKRILDAGLLSRIVAALSHRSARVRACACHCVRGLSRSVNVLKTSLVDTDAARPLWRCVAQDEDETVRVCATQAVCNLVIDFSPMRDELIRNGCVNKFCEFLESTNGSLRLYAIFALKNVTYGADQSFRRGVAEKITWDRLLRLIECDDVDISRNSLVILRNLACNSEEDLEASMANGTYGPTLTPAPGISASSPQIARSTSAPSKTPHGGAPASDLEAMAVDSETVAAASKGLLESIGEERLLSLLELKLDAKAEDSIVTQAIWTVVNLATGTESCKRAIINRAKLLRNIISLLTHGSTEIRVAAVFAIINLTQQSAHSRRPAETFAKLQAYNVEHKLRRMAVEEDNVEVRSKVMDALANF